jgi:hypothetical protein
MLQIALLAPGMPCSSATIRRAVPHSLHWAGGTPQVRKGTVVAEGDGTSMQLPGQAAAAQLQQAKRASRRVSPSMSWLPVID